MKQIIQTLTWLTLMSAALQANATQNTDWMASNWGVRVVLPAGNNQLVEQFDPAILVRQLATLKTPKWVMINATQGGYGGFLTTPNSKLSEEVNKSMAPNRDLLGETVRLLKTEGFRVIIYFASEGPGGRVQNNADDDDAPQGKKAIEMTAIRLAWSDFLRKNNVTNEQAISQYMLEPIARKFGLHIDGWWFDHGKWGDARRYINTVRKFNQNTKVGWNEKHKIIKLNVTNEEIWAPKQSNMYEDFTAGHVTPTRRMAPWSPANESVIDDIEQAAKQKTNKINSNVVNHLFIPLQRHWRKGEAGFPTLKAINWTQRILQSGSAITWAIALKQPEFLHSELSEKQIQQLKELDDFLLKEGAASIRPR